MKAILVIDIPTCCEKCHLLIYRQQYYTSSRDESFDEISCFDGRKLFTEDFKTQRCYECPMKPMPEKRSLNYTSDYHGLYRAEAKGWNACIDEILGETE